MWQVQTQTIKPNWIEKYSIYRNQQQLTYGEVIDLWRDSEEFCLFFNALLAESGFAAYFWETPPIDTANIDRLFEFVLVNYPRLQTVKPNPHSFRKYLDKEESIVTFPNLRGDATLVVPCPIEDDSIYTHIANFVRKADSLQQIALWQNAGNAIATNLNKNPLWVSTSGLGVYWLHIRLDSVPKYYSYQPYKSFNRQ